MPTCFAHWRNQFRRNASTVSASLVVAAVIGVLYFNYLAAAAATIGGSFTLPLVY